MISSVTGLETPPFPGEAVYYANKVCLETFSNFLRMETSGSDIRVLVLSPGVVQTHFHLQKVKYDKDAMDELFYGYESVVKSDVAEMAV
jgi:3-hydroxy acid dehydrogenase/malonic semialdehyde reductase